MKKETIIQTIINIILISIIVYMFYTNPTLIPTIKNIILNIFRGFLILIIFLITLILLLTLKIIMFKQGSKETWLTFFLFSYLFIFFSLSLAVTFKQFQYLWSTFITVFLTPYIILGTSILFDKLNNKN